VDFRVSGLTVGFGLANWKVQLDRQTDDGHAMALPIPFLFNWTFHLVIHSNKTHWYVDLLLVHISI
jgi:hypothetical protein